MPPEPIDTPLVHRWVPSPNFEPRRCGRGINMLIIHYTGMADHDGALRWLTNPASKVSCHYIVDEDGTITQMVAERERAWHAGAGSWRGEDDINSCSVGIEIHNPGHDGGSPPFPHVQMDAVSALARDIVARYAISPTRVLAHSDVAPQRKPDPGERFDWAKLYRAGVGIWVPEAPTPAGSVTVSVSDKDADVTADQIPASDVARARQLLARLGYEIAPECPFDEGLRNVLIAFQRHWRQSHVDGLPDAGTLATLEHVIAAFDQHEASGADSGRG